MKHNAGQAFLLGGGGGVVSVKTTGIKQVDLSKEHGGNYHTSLF